MARANPANKSQPNDGADIEIKSQPNDTAETENKQEPIIEFYGDGAEDVKFNIDQNATRIRVYATGLILTDY